MNYSTRKHPSDDRQETHWGIVLIVFLATLVPIVCMLIEFYTRR